MTPFDHIQLVQADGVASIILNHPPVNAMNIQLLSELEVAVAKVEADPDVHVIVFKSANEKMFSAGADVSLLEQSSLEEMDLFCRRIKSLTLSLRASSKIYIASIEGHCLGGGLELALGCDLRVAKDAKFKLGLPEINLGLFPGGGGIQLAARLIGTQKAFRLAAFGEILTASEAKEWGLVDYLLPQEGYSEKLAEMATNIAARPSVAISRIKHLVYHTSELDLDTAFDLESTFMEELLGKTDFKEGIRAFKEKRKPLFIDKV